MQQIAVHARLSLRQVVVALARLALALPDRGGSLRTQWRIVAGGLAIGMVLAAAPAAGAAPAPVGAAGSRGVTLTLVTGDRVVLGAGDEVVAVRPGPGREKVNFVRWSSGDARYVIPTDAEPLLRAGRIDRRLFDARGLARAGYHDAARASVPLIVTYGVGAARSSFATAGARVTRDLPAIGGGAVSLDKAKAAGWWSAVAGGTGALRSKVEKVWLDGLRTPSLDRSVPRIGAPAAWRSGFTGKGVTVAVLDSGVDTTHPDLAGKVRESRNFTTGPDGDTVGHGTHVASTIAGSGAASGGRYKGVAPDAALVSGKVCESFCLDSEVIAGMQWAAADAGATVVNMSLGGTDTPEIDPVEEAVNRLTAEHGTLFVISAGNLGPAAGSVQSPGSAEAALTVGAVDRTDALARTSSRGPRVGDDGLKPDITAPGVDIIAARAAGTELGTAVNDRYTMLSGTSMAAPHVAGTAALLAQRHPDWPAARLKAGLMGSARPNPELSGYQQGAGRVDAARAVSQPVTADPASVSYGRTTWPHADDEPIGRTVTYHNDGDTAVTLDVTVRVVGPGGVAAPAGMFRSSVDRVTVPAGGQAVVTVTADTGVDGPEGLYSGQLVARGGSTTVSTPVSVHKEPPTYQLTIRHVDATGAPATGASTFVHGIDNDEDDLHGPEDGVVTLRLPRGRYGVYTIMSDGAETPNYAIVSRPLVDLTADTTVTVDAREAKPLELTVAEPTAQPTSLDVWYAHYSSDSPDAFGTNISFTASFAEKVYTARSGDPAPGDWVRSRITSQLAKPDGEGGFADSPYLYALGEIFEGDLPTGFTRHYAAGDLAAVRHRFHAAPPGPVAERSVGLQFGATSFIPTSLPGERAEYYSDEAEVAWTDLLLDSGITLLSKRALFRYEPGTEHREDWHAGPFGPALDGAYYDTEWVTRLGDVITAGVPLHGDGGGHPGHASYDAARVALYRDGRLVKETPRAADRFVVPAKPGQYRLEAFASQSATDLSTEVSSVWTFRSGRVAGTTAARLPIQTVRFTPTLDERNAAPPGRFQIPVTVQRQPGAPSATVRRVTVDVSYDDGRTWRPVLLRPARDGWVGTVVHPGDARFASLRATATDSAGSTVTQTIRHAYRIG
jgi:subtilisin family serine protease